MGRAYFRAYFREEGCCALGCDLSCFRVLSMPQQAVSLICTKHCLWPEQSSCSGGLGLGFCSLINPSTSTADSEDLVVRTCLQVRLLRTRWRVAVIRLLLNYTTAPLGARGPSVLSTLCSSCRGRFGAWSSFLVPRMSHLFVAPSA